MIDNRTTNKNYPLPHPENIASQDVERIATSISMIDADMQACSDAANSIVDTVQKLDKNSLRIPTESIWKIDPELKNLAPRQYIVVNDDASGFSTVEGGGGEGGKKGEILVKRSDANFDTTWMDPRAILKRAPIIYEATGDCYSKNNNMVILADDIEIDNNNQTATKNIVDDGVIKIVPTCAYYRAFINTDTLFSFEFRDFAPKKDIAFDLEIVSDGVYVVNFGPNVVWDLPCAGVSLGSTIIHFEKLFGEPNFHGTLKQAAKASVKLLTPDTSADITNNYICGHNGSGWQALFAS